MFTVANELSYGGFMINKTINPKEPIEPCKASCWITYDGSNIKSTTGKDRYIQVQGQIAFELIQKLRARNVEFKDIFIITPFTSCLLYTSIITTPELLMVCIIQEVLYIIK